MRSYKRFSIFLEASIVMFHSINIGHTHIYIYISDYHGNNDGAYDDIQWMDTLGILTIKKHV